MSGNESKKIKLELDAEPDVFDVIKATSQLSQIPLLDLVLVAKQGESEEPSQIDAQVLMSTIQRDSVKVEVKQFNKSTALMNLVPARTATQTQHPNNDIRAIIEMSKPLGINIRSEEDNKSDPIHDITTEGGSANFKPPRKKFNKHFLAQFYHVEKAIAQKLNLARKYSPESPIDVGLTWTKQDGSNIGRAVENVQGCMFSFDL